ncbi:hypothetical protein DL89DRAFT_127858 [Linderina pennispora]|uniref:Uncharacterized protein n=1 Tax=Linderina pennispora TaxID=61395 RepID=A0A1Y1WDA4_9FUNG|nr:uncharacterized protein DL89DRAFT_127858 [Linderina pennispora]ORX71520.1 hypothetical protein DL89DRAFT_127858 [Linderina pennispora]
MFQRLHNAPTRAVQTTPGWQGALFWGGDISIGTPLKNRAWRLRFEVSAHSFFLGSIALCGSYIQRQGVGVSCTGEAAHQSRGLSLGGQELAARTISPPAAFHALATSTPIAPKYEISRHAAPERKWAAAYAQHSGIAAQLSVACSNAKSSHTWG